MIATQIGTTLALLFPPLRHLTATRGSPALRRTLRENSPSAVPEIAMKRSSLLQSVILLSAGTAAVAVLAGCGGPPALPQSSVPASLARHRATGSVSPDNLGPQDLLFVSNSNGLVNIYHFWQHTLAGVLTNFTKPMGMCVDNARNVYIADYGAETIVEYTHGGALVRTINDAPYAPYGCAVDSTTGNLAVANYDTPATYSYNNNSGSIEIYKHAKGKPVTYGVKTGKFTTLSYDDSGDLLASGLNSYYYGFYYTTFFDYLPKHGTQLLSMTLPNSQFRTSDYGWPAPQSINYDGKYWVVTAENTMYRYSIGVKAVEIDYQALTGASGDVGEIWFYRKTRTAPAIRVVAGGDAYNKANVVDYWKYPVSGNPYATISSDLDGPYGVAISLRISK